MTKILGSSLIWTFRISNICFYFPQAGALEKIKTNIRYSKFDTSKSMSYQGPNQLHVIDIIDEKTELHVQMSLV